VVRIVGDALYRGVGGGGLFLWGIQAAVIGMAVSLLVDRATRRLLPLAALFSMSLVFPDEAPSRFSVALRSGSARRLSSEAGQVKPIEAGIDPNEAAAIALGLVADLSRHDRLTRGHTERVRAYADMIGEEMELDRDARIRLSWAGLLHDVGKLTVPEPILNKPGRPNTEEWEILRNHPAAALELLGPLADWLGEWVLAATQHHERWDGDGYPGGLAGTDISLAGRIVAVADTYDVITSKRSYKEPMSAEAARRELVACSGSQFDPEVVRAFLNVSLGRRWLAGPFASLLNMPAGSVGGALSPLPAAVAAAAIAVSAGAIPEAMGTQRLLAFQPPETTVATAATTVAAFGRNSTLTEEVSAPISSATLAQKTTTSVPTTESTASTSTSQPPVTPIDPEPPATTTSTSTTAPPSTTPTPAPSTTATTNTDPPGSPPPPSLTTTTTVLPPTTTKATLVPPPTVVKTTATTTAIVPPAIYYMKSNGIGDTKLQRSNQLSTLEPDNTTLPNYDTDIDGLPGQRLLPTSDGLAEIDPRRIQTYRIIAASALRLNGSVTGKVFVQPAGSSGPIVLRSVLRDCNSAETACTTLADETNPTTNDSWGPVAFSFGSIDHLFAAGRHLVMVLITEGSGALDVGFDADDAPSYLLLPLE
jgi:hypothetical protein